MNYFQSKYSERNWNTPELRRLNCNFKNLQISTKPSLICIHFLPCPFHGLMVRNNNSLHTYNQARYLYSHADEWTLPLDTLHWGNQYKFFFGKTHF